MGSLKELFEITMFNAGTICNPSQTDIPAEAASNSLNLDPISEDGKLKGIPINTNICSNVGDDKNILLQNVSDSTKHDLIYYKDSNNTLYVAEDLYDSAGDGAATEATLGTLTATTDEVPMEAMEGALYIGQGTGNAENPKWVGRLDHGQWGDAASGSLSLESDSLLPPNLINEVTSACTDGTYIYAVYGGQHGTYNYNTTESLKYASGEIVKIRVSDGKIMARSNRVIGPVNAICLSWDGNDIWALTSEKWSVAKNVYTGSISTFASANGDDDTTVTSSAHGLVNGDTIIITGTANYDGTGTVSEVTTDTFQIDAPFVDSTMSFGSELNEQANAITPSGSSASEANDAAGWTNAGMSTFASSTDNETTGTYSLHLVANGDGDYAHTNFTTTAGRRYRFSWDRTITNHDSGSKFDFKVGTSANDNSLGEVDSFASNTSTSVVTGEYVDIVATSSSTFFTVTEDGGDNDGILYLDNLSVKEITDTWTVPETTNLHVLNKFNSNDLKSNAVITTNLDTAIREAKGTTAAGDYWEALADNTDNTGNRWEDEGSYWEGANPYDYQGTFSDILELDGTLWVCTSAGALFNSTSIEGTSVVFANRTPYGLGYYYKTDTNTEVYMAPGGDLNETGGWYNNGATAWRFPECHNASLMQLTGSNDWVGMYVRNGELSDGMKFDLGGSNLAVEKKSLIFSVSESADPGLFIDGTDNVRTYYLNDSSLISSDGVREINNVMYKCPKDIYKSAYQVIKTWGAGGMEWNIAEFDNPAYDGTHGDPITVALVEGDDTAQIPIRISDTVIVGLISDAYLGVGDQNSAADADARNKYRTMSKWTDDGGWSRADFGTEMYLSQRAHLLRETEDASGFHQANAGYFYRYSFVYDGFQESPLGASMHIWSTGKKVEIPFVFSTDNFPKRITAIRVYRATSISTADRDIGGFYHFIGEIDIESQQNVNLSTDTSYTDGQDGVNEGDELRPDESRYFTFVDQGTSGATYETMSGLFEAMTDSNVKYSLSTQLNSSLFVAKCDHETQIQGGNMIYKSLPYKPSCINWALDFLKLPEVPTAIQAFNGRIYAFSESKTYKIEPNSFYIEDIYEGAGCLGPDAVQVSDFGMCYCDNNNIYLHQGQTPTPIGDSILTSDASIGYLDFLDTSSYSPKIGFDAKRKCFVVFLTTTRAWAYNMVRQVWNLWETQGTTNGICQGKKGEILAAVSDGHLYDMLSSATRKSNWYWVSKRLSMHHKTQNKRWYEAIIAYTGDGSGDAPSIAIYWDYNTGAASISSGESEDNIIRKQLGDDVSAVNHRLVQIKVTAGDATTEVDSIGFTFRRFEALVDQGSA